MVIIPPTITPANKALNIAFCSLLPIFDADEGEHEPYHRASFFESSLRHSGPVLKGSNLNLRKNKDPSGPGIEYRIEMESPGAKGVILSSVKMFVGRFLQLLGITANKAGD